MYHIGADLIKSKVLNSSSSLRVLAFGGEHCPALPVLRQWTHSECPTELYNLYGITEVSCWASCHHIAKAELRRKSTVYEGHKAKIDVAGVDLGFCQHGLLNDNVPIGIPLQNTVIEVRDGEGKIVNEGLGQIHIGGANRVCLLDNETNVTEATLRATGDWAFVKDGTIWYCGRTDRQIKRNGKRINLDWIQRTMSEALGLPCSLIVGESSHRSLQKFYLFVATGNSDHPHHKLRSFLRKNVGDLLPAFAQPDATFLVPRFPMTSHGKVDKPALLDSVRLQQAERKVPVKRFLEEAWAEALRLQVSNLFDKSDRSPAEPEGAKRKRLAFEEERNTQSCRALHEIRTNDEDMFVASGGSSLAAVRLADVVESWMRETCGASLQAPELVDIILNQTFGDLRIYVESKTSSTSRRDETGANHNGSEYLPGNQALVLAESRVRHVHLPCMAQRNDGKGRANVEDNRAECHIPGIDLPDVPGSVTQKSAEWEKDISPKRKKFSEPSRESVEQCSRADVEHRAGNGCYCSVRPGMQRTMCLSCQNRCSAERAGPESHVCADMNRPPDSRGTGVVKVTEKWKTCLYKCIDASPLVVTSSERRDGEVYVGSHGHVFMAVRLSDGHVMWEREVGGRVESSAVLSSCGTYVIVGCYDGKLYVFERLTGAPVWTPETDGPIKSSPVVDPNTARVWVGSHDHFLYGFDVTKKQRACAVHCGGGACFSSPRVSREPHVIYASTVAGVVSAVDPYEYSILWRQRCPKAVFASPLVFSSGVLCACVDGLVYSFSHQGDALWSFQTQDAIFSTPALVESLNPSNSLIVLGSHDRHLYCLNTEGHVIWSFRTDAHVYCTPFITCSSRDYTPPTGEVYVFSTIGTLFVLDLRSGHLLETTSLPGEVFSSPVVAADQIVVGCRNDFLYSLELE